MDKALHIINLDIPKDYSHDIEAYIDSCQDDIKATVSQNLAKLNRYSCKLYVDIIINLERTTPCETNGSPIDHFYIRSNAQLYTKSELDTFIDDIRGIIRQRLEDHRNELQESGRIIKDIAGFKILMCQFRKEGLGHYSPYPIGLCGSHQTFNPVSGENGLLIALASHFVFKENPNVNTSNLHRRVWYAKQGFWESKVNVGGLSHEEIGWESLYELEELNKVSILLYNLTLLKKRKKYRLQLVYKSKLNYETVPLLLINNLHVCYIRNLKSFCASLGRYRESITDLCPQCLTVFKNSQDCEQHCQDCNLETVIKYPIIQTLNDDADNEDEEVSLITEEDDAVRGEKSSSNEHSTLTKNNDDDDGDLLIEVDMKDKGGYTSRDHNRKNDDGNVDNVNNNIINPFFFPTRTDLIPFHSCNLWWKP